MSYFIIPQRWITPAITAAALALGSIPSGEKAHIQYYSFSGRYLSDITRPSTIWLDKRPRSEWPKWRAQCVMIHEYGRLAGRKNSANPNNIMHPIIRKKPCVRWLRRHDL